MKTVLLTRPKTQALILAEKIRQLNWQPIIFPVIDIKPPPDIFALHKISEQLAQFHIIIFISPAAVEFMRPWIKQKPAATLMTIGADTALAIKKQGWGEAIFPPDQFNRDALLALPLLQQLSGISLLICQSAAGNPILSQTLIARGANVVVAECYQRCLPQVKELPPLAIVDIIICTSQEGLENLVQLFGQKIYAKKLLVSSERLAHVARQLGFQEIPIIASNAGDEALLTALQTVAL